MCMEASDRLLKYVGKLLSENGIRMVAECPEYCEQAHSLTRMNGLSMAFFRILELQLPLVEDIGPDDEIVLTYQFSNFISLTRNKQFYTLAYDGNGFYLYYQRSFQDDNVMKLRDCLMSIDISAKREQQNILKEELGKKRVAIRNYFMSDWIGLEHLRKYIEAQYQEFAYSIGDGSMSSLLYYNSQPSMEVEKENIEFSSEIASYIQKVFGLIEHVSMCLLPLWEYSQSKQWEEIKKAASSYFYPDTWTTFLLHKDDFKDDYMYLFEKVMKKFNPQLRIEYRALKNDYRNVITHGYLTSMRLDNLTTVVPSLTKHFDNFTQPSFNQLDYFSFKRVSLFVNEYLQWIKELNPAHYCLIIKGLDIPADASEIVAYVGDNEEKANAFVEEWKNLSDPMNNQI